MAQKVRLGKSPVRIDMWIYTSNTKPDTDNILKGILDAFQKAAVFDNDRQVCEHHVYRVRSTKPRVEVTVEQTEERTEV